MFNKNKLAEILKRIISQYHSISEFSEKSLLDRTYISKCINKKLEHPPSPNILRKISNNSNNITNYIDLMYICDYLNDNDIGYLKNTNFNTKNYETVASINHDFMTYYMLNEIGQEKVNDYMTDLKDTNKYNRKI